jgi:serine/threonine-protein kinase
VSVSADPRIGSELAGYLIEALVGRGGMGVVYRAHDRALDRKVALKILSPELAADVGFRERFLIESRLAAALDHPNVIPIYDAGEVAGELYIAMRFVEGSDLRELFQAGALAPERAIALVSQVAEALDAAHARGLVHRDVKPANVLVAETDHVYLADFGLTRRLGAAPGQLGAGRSLGTSDYVAPEQIRGEEVDGRADVYSLGCLLYECLVGRPPFQRDSEIAVVYAHLEEVPPKPSVRRPELSEEIDGVVARAMAKTPSERYATCTQLVDAARAGLRLTGDLSSAASGRYRRALVLVTVVALLALAAVLALYLGAGGGTPGAAAGMMVRIDPGSNRPMESVRLPGHVSAIAAGRRGVWALSFRDGALWRVDPSTGTVTKIAPVGSPRDVALHEGRAYVVSQGPKLGADNVTVYDAADGSRIDGIELIGYVVRAGSFGVWTAGWLDANRLSSRGTLRIAARVPIPGWYPLDAAHDREQLNDVGFGMGSLWVLGDAADRRLWRIDPGSRRVVSTIRLSFVPAGLAVGAGSVWVTDQLDDTVVRLDPASGHVLAVIPVGSGVRGVAFGAGGLWAASALDDTLSRIDPETDRVVARIRLGLSPRDVSITAGSVWAGGDAS